MEGLGDTLSRMARQQWELTKASPVGKFARYQLDPESFLKPNERLKPGLTDGYQYSLKPGETTDDAGTVYGQDGQPVTFKSRPQLSSLADLLGYMVGGVGGAPKGAVGAGIHRRVHNFEPSLDAGDPTVHRELALKMEAMHKRGSQGYAIPDKNPETLDKADKALTRVSTKDPLPRYEQSAGRALDMGFDTPAFHATTHEADPAVARLLAGTPWRELDPTYKARGAFYLGDFDKPTAGIRSSAAQLGYGEPKIYPFLVKDVFGENALPSGLQKVLPDRIKGGFDTTDIYHGLQDAPGYSDNLAAAMEAAKERYGSGFDTSKFLSGQASARQGIAELLARNYYAPPENGVSFMSAPRRLLPPHEFKPVGVTDTSAMPHYSTFESGGVPNLNGKPQSGLHSPWQNELGAMGFSGARVADEMRNVGAKSFGMFDPTGVRAVGAKFENPTGDLLSAVTPPSSWFDLFSSREEPTP